MCHLLSGAAVSLALTLSAALGPPGVCGNIECGPAASSVDAAWSGVTRRNVVERLPGVLDRFSENTIARMEVLRRTLFLEGASASEVVGALSLRALEREASGEYAAAAVFDAGYAIHLYATMGDDQMERRAVKDGIPGYALVARAIQMKPDAGMHVGAAFVTLPAMQPRGSERLVGAKVLFAGHCEAALRGASAGSAEEANLAFVLKMDDQSIEQVRARLSVK
jgi:hypothetical protein